jgi:hypothetical protein
MPSHEQVRSRMNRRAVASSFIGFTWVLLAVVWGVSAAGPAAAGVEIGPSHTESALPGDDIVYNHTLTNTGTTTDTFVLQLSSSQEWPVQLVGAVQPTGTLELEVAAQATEPFQVNLTIPLGTAGLTDQTLITATSQLSPTVYATVVDTTIVQFYQMLFPIALHHWPPLPYTPTLNPIQNADQDGNYTVTWTAADLADTYSLEEDDNPNFTSPTVVFSGAALSWQATDKSPDTYYYRVRGHNSYGFGPYSNVQSVIVVPPTPTTPTLNPIENADLDGNYTVSWTAADRATTYSLEEDDNDGFTSPKIVYSGSGLSWQAPNRTTGLYYYRVRGHNDAGYGPYSNIQWTKVSFRADDTSLTVGGCTTLRWDFTGIKAIYVTFGYGYDPVGVAGVSSHQVCPSVDTTYKAIVTYPDNSQKTYTEFIDVSGTGCADPVIWSFEPTTYQVSPGVKFSIFWSTDCADAVFFKFGANPEVLVPADGSWIDAQIYGNTTFQLRLHKDGWGDAYATFVVTIK